MKPQKKATNAKILYGFKIPEGMKKATNAKILYGFKIPEGMMIDPLPSEIECIPTEAAKKVADAVASTMEKNLMQALSIPQHLLDGPTTYSTMKSDFLDALAYSLRGQQIRMDRVMQREQAICLIWGELLAAGFKGPAVRSLAGLLWMAGQCFERSLDALAKHHHLGDWRFKRLA